MTIRQLSLPYLNRLVQDCNETAFLSVYDTQKHAAMFVAAVESPHALRYVVQLHEWMPVHVGASGLAILAFLPDAEQREVLTKELGELSASTYRRWKEKLAHVRTIGFAETTGQRVPGAVGIAAPIFAPNQRVVGDVGLSIPEQRFSASRGSQLAQMVVNTAERISRQLSGMLASMGDGTNGSIWSRALSTQ